MIQIMKISDKNYKKNSFKEGNRNLLDAPLLPSKGFWFQKYLKTNILKKSKSRLFLRIKKFQRFLRFIDSAKKCPLGSIYINRSSPNSLKRSYNIVKKYVKQLHYINLELQYQKIYDTKSVIK